MPKKIEFVNFNNYEKTKVIAYNLCRFGKDFSANKIMESKIQRSSLIQTNIKNMWFVFMV